MYVLVGNNCQALHSFCVKRNGVTAQKYQKTVGFQDKTKTWLTLNYSLSDSFAQYTVIPRMTESSTKKIPQNPQKAMPLLPLPFNSTPKHFLHVRPLTPRTSISTNAALSCFLSYSIIHKLNLIRHWWRIERSSHSRQRNKGECHFDV